MTETFKKIVEDFASIDLTSDNASDLISKVVNRILDEKKKEKNEKKRGMNLYLEFTSSPEYHNMYNVVKAFVDIKKERFIE